jgi:coenzyme F420-dependent glucose-6-phosphate dehydrogenase
MVELGYALPSEEHAPRDLVGFAKRAEETGFSFALISDQFHPWTSRQLHSPFAWGVIGGIAATTHKLRLGTGVTCPTMRIHPAIIALGGKWPSAEIRQEKLEEAVRIIRMLWEGGVKSHRGHYFKVENAQVFTLPKEVPPIFIAAGGDKAATVAAKIAGGLITAGDEEKVIKVFNAAGGKRKPRYSQVTVCWAKARNKHDA